MERSPLGRPNATLGSGNNSANDELKQRFEAALKGIREEFDDHLETINDNTNEIEANYEVLCKLEAKVDKVQEQLEQLQLAMARFMGTPSQHDEPAGIELDEREKDVFLILYTAADEKPLTYREIAAALKESEFLVRGYITNMIEKGVPIAKRYVNDSAYISLDKSFKDRQAKENVVRLSQKTVREFVV